MKSRNSIYTLVVCTFLALHLVGCAEKAIDDNDPKTLFADAEEEVKSDRFQLAIDKFRIVKNKFPYSSYSIEAQLRIGDVYFLEESYAEAAAAYESFRDLHPKHEKVAYAMFRIAKSYFNDIPSTTARDMMSGQKAIDAYGDFLKRFSAAPEAPEARQDVVKLRALMAEKELNIANFYIREKQPDAARPRFQKIVDFYSDTPSAKEAKDKLEKLPPPAPRQTKPVTMD